ncbi:MAG: nuclear transport factor 2 family protein [Brevundimonas sp.]|jgi:hypothetical protein|uniref:nuclear transport factor 2 family protein n=1 Tax=Brevundimonas sp. TaxID=1871086 RepID=UPI0022C2E023|nr:nuclear transport factor 2 family protein [Brevundimonas sp.]MCZ8086549.1 nuclear transport factor 2 family protein [Brevundimonas sp.]MCZ8194616.1 nuclear transport factor 2 family protein [Brevundimonas sp.]
MIDTPIKMANSPNALVSIDSLRRRRVVSAILALPVIAFAGAASSGPAFQQGGPDARVVTLTFLKSAPGRLSQLERYVRANWFAMDEIAVQRGLFVSYGWFDTGSDEGPWNAIVMVTYRDARGFAGIQDAWSEIRAAHREVRIDGATQADLGRIVESREIFERTPFVTAPDLGTPPAGTGPDTALADETAVRAVVDKYFEGGVTGNPEPIREAFLPSARIEGLRGDQLVTWSFDDYVRNFDGTPAPGADRIERNVTRVAIQGDSATVQLRLRFSPSRALDEQLLLLRINGQWRITYKSYTPSAQSLIG